MILVIRGKHFLIFICDAKCEEIKYSLGYELTVSLYHLTSAFYLQLNMDNELFNIILCFVSDVRTIIYLSMVYILGNTVMTFTAFPPPYW